MHYGKQEVWQTKVYWGERLRHFWIWFYIVRFKLFIFLCKNQCALLFTWAATSKAGLSDTFSGGGSYSLLPDEQKSKLHSWKFFCDTSLLPLNCFCFVYLNNSWSSCSKGSTTSVITTLASRLPQQNYFSLSLSECNLTALGAFITFSDSHLFHSIIVLPFWGWEKPRFELLTSATCVLSLQALAPVPQRKLKRLSNYMEGASGKRPKQISWIPSLWKK